MHQLGAVIGYAASPFALTATNVRLSLTSMPSPAADADSARRLDELAGLVLDVAYLRPEAFASDRST